MTDTAQHEWVISTLGHGDTMCKHCRITSFVAAALGLSNVCDKPQMEAIPMTEPCRKCGARMKPGKALAQTIVGVPDFPGDDHPITMSAGGPGRMIDCLKCENCGWSVTK